MPRPIGDAPTCVYYCWAGDELLYIGTTRQPLKREQHHRYTSRRWFPTVDHVDLKWYPTRELAESVERAAIARYRPSHNNRLNYRDPAPCRLCAAPTRTDDQLCDRCAA